MRDGVGPAPYGVGPAPTITPQTPEPDPLAGRPDDAIVVTVIDDGGSAFSLQVGAISTGGIVRPIARLGAIRPAGWNEASPAWYGPPVVGPPGYLAIGVERNGGNDEADDDHERTLIYDLRDPGRAPIELGSIFYHLAFGPDGSLAAFGAEVVRIIDPATGLEQRLPTPDDVVLDTAWLADGSGFLATRYDLNSGEPTPGAFLFSGEFVPGRAAAWAPTGRERLVGAGGGTLGLAVSDGPFGSESAIIESRPDRPAGGVVWASYTEPGDDARFDEAVWDAAGTGIWLTRTSRDNRRSWLSHMTTPLTDTRVATLPRPGWMIAGLSADDAWAVLSSDADHQLMLVDASTGGSRILASGPDRAPVFAGWLSTLQG
jgi:hypothetical protein